MRYSVSTIVSLVTGAALLTSLSVAAPPLPTPAPAPQVPGPPQLCSFVPKLAMLTWAGEVSSEPDGTASVNFTIYWYSPGKPGGCCKARLSAYASNYLSVETKFEISPGSKFPMVVPLKLPRPGAWKLTAIGETAYIGGCEGIVTKDLKVKPHPDFPCNLYPGFRKSSIGVAWTCSPTSPPADVQPHQFKYLCEGANKYASVGGYVFGCLPPEWWATQ